MTNVSHNKKLEYTLLMNGYLGEFELDKNDNPYKDYDKSDWMAEYIQMYGGIDGSHHKDWVMDQCIRIWTGSEVIVKQARWKDGEETLEEYRIDIGEPTEKYKKMVEDTEEAGYGWNYGIAP